MSGPLVFIIDNGSEVGRRAARDWLAGWGAERYKGRGASVKRMLRPWAWFGIELWKLISTRVTIPWICWRASRRGASGPAR